MKLIKTLALCFFIFSMTNCSDPCSNVDCGPGMCEDGTCICPTGYEGTSCETESRSLTYGLYDLTMSECGATVTLDIDRMEIQERSGDIFSVSVTLIEDGAENFTLDGTLSGNSLEATGESSGIDIITRGTFSEDSNTFTGEIVVVGFASCDVTFVK